MPPPSPGSDRVLLIRSPCCKPHPCSFDAGRPSPSGTAYGIDGCSAGWLYVASARSGEPRWGIVEAIEELVSTAADSDRIFVDIPIGLPNGPEGRPCDRDARKRLGARRAGTVFPAPVRAALAADTSRRLASAPFLRPGYPSLPLLGWRETKRARGDRTAVASYCVLVFGVGQRASHPERPGRGVCAARFLAGPPAALMNSLSLVFKSASTPGRWDICGTVVPRAPERRLMLAGPVMSTLLAQAVVLLWIPLLRLASGEPCHLQSMRA